MSNFPTLRVSACVAAIVTAPAAFADVTAAQIWSEWQEIMSLTGDEGGLTFTGGQDQGGTVTVEDLTITYNNPDVDLSAELGTLVFEEQGDGTVKITMAESYPMTVMASDGGGMNMTVTQDGFEVIASGTPELTNYALSADRYGITVDELVDPDGAASGDMRMILNAVSGAYTVSMGDLRDITYAIQTGSVDFLMDLSDPNSGAEVLISGKVDNLEANAQATLPDQEEIVGSPTVFAAGMAALGNYTFTGSNYIFDISESGDKIQGAASTGAGSVSANVNVDRMEYDFAVNDMTMDLQTPDLPFPVNVNLTEYGMGLAMPLAKSDQSQDFGFQMSLVDLAVNDEIWMLGDPSGALPHDPVTIKLDLSGKARLFFDLMDPTQTEAIALAEMPGELNELSLNDLTLRAAGAEVTGTGDFVFDNTDLTTFDGFPRPEGSVTVNVNGANALIDSLVGMGLLPEDQAMMGRMMMGMFARTVGDDQLTSTLEVNAEGHVLANGQRIQ